jgi:hypothetical protein
MSQASDLIAEVKTSLAKATAGVKRFEGELGEIGRFTDLAHLNIAAIHLREFVSSLEHQSNQPEPAVQPDTPSGLLGAPLAPADLVAGFKKDELQAAAAVQGVEVASGATKTDIAEAIVAQQAVPVDDPAAGLIAAPQPPAA